MTDHLPFTLFSREDTPPLSPVLGTLLRVWVLENTAEMYPLKPSVFIEHSLYAVGNNYTSVPLKIRPWCALRKHLCVGLTSFSVPL
jgi:hypothetical protein